MKTLMRIFQLIFNYLNDVFLGPYYFQTALMYRTTLLLNSYLINSESWYNLSNTDIQQLESVDNIIHRRILETPISIMHLELGTLPIKYVIKCRRLLFLQYILKEEKDSLLFKFFEAQFKFPQKGDWVLQAKEDLNEVRLNMTFDQISKMSDDSFQCKVKKAINQLAFNWLISEKNKPRNNSTPKGSKLVYDQLKMQDYFLPSTMNNKQCNLLFSLRSNMVPVKTNFRHSYADLTCPVCLEPSQLDTQVHTLHCKTLLDGENIVINSKVCHDDIFSDDIQKQSAVVTLFEKLSVKRRKLVKES